jgi:hypothetical protein
MASALDALNGMTTGKSDPKFQQVQAALSQATTDAGAVAGGLGGTATHANAAAFIAAGVKSQVTTLAPQLTAAASGAAQLAAGIAWHRGPLPTGTARAGAPDRPRPDR